MGKPPDRDTDTVNDLELLHQIGRGDTSAWGCFYTRWSSRLQRSAERVLLDAEEANGAVSEAVIRIRELAIRGVHPKRSEDVEKWVFAKVRTCAMRLRERRDIPVDSLEWLAVNDDASTDSEETTPEYQITLLRRAMRRLSPESRQALSLRFISRHSYREIAAVQGGGKGSARQRVERGLLQLVGVLFAVKRVRCASQLSVAEYAHVLDVTAQIRARNPDTRMPELIREVCRKTGILISSRSCAIALVGNSRQRRYQ